MDNERDALERAEIIRDKALRDSLAWIKANLCDDWGKMIAEFEDHFNLSKPV